MEKIPWSTPLLPIKEKSYVSRKRKKSKLRKKRSSKEFVTRTGSEVKENRPARLFSFIAGSGFLLAILTIAYQYFSGNVSLEYIQPIGRAYEFRLNNDTPSDKVVVRFRVSPPGNQQVMYETTKDVYLPLNSDGQAIPPVTYVPAAEFEELDGRIISANSSFKFRVPPLSNLPWMKPNAAIVNVQYQLESSNWLLRLFERALGHIGLGSNKYDSKYLVIDNYWIPSHSESIDEAVRVYCRENSDVASTKLCAENS